MKPRQHPTGEDMKLVAWAVALAAVTAATAPLVVGAEDPPLVVQIVDALQERYGVQPGYRANHAKGIVVTGSFQASGAGRAITVSPLFALGAALPVIVRFSDAGGDPLVTDASPLANPHGMAMKFMLPGAIETDIVVNALKFFPVATAEDFRDLQLAAAQSPPGAAQPTKLDLFLQTHPSVERANATLGVPDSFAHEVFYGVNAFVFINAAGRKQAFRYIIQPSQVVHLRPEQTVAQHPNFLFDELPSRLARGPVSFHIKVQLAEPGDPTNDATKAWPDTRNVVDLGTLMLDKLVPDSDAEQRKLLFLPGRLTPGIEPSDDPLIAARDGSYAVSFGRRSVAPR
jgi:catalase